MKKILLKLAVFPPPHRGVRVFNSRLHQYILSNHINALFVTFETKNDPLESTLHLNIRKFRSLKVLLSNMALLFSLRKRLVKDYSISPPALPLVRCFLISLLLSAHLRKNIHYFSLCDHLGDQQIILTFLRYLGFNIKIQTYLHGAGLIEKYNSNPK